jgi:hypothetical protein
MFAGAFELDWVPMSLREESELTRLSADLPHNFPFGQLQLCGDRDLVSGASRGVYTRELAARHEDQPALRTRTR